MMIVPLERERWGRGFAFSLNGMNVPNWINVLVYMVTVQSRHGIVIFNNQVFCPQRGDGRVKILDKELCELYRETSRTEIVTSVLNVVNILMCLHSD